MKKNNDIPNPFLGPIFPVDEKFTINEGWLYSETEKQIHSFEKHEAIDFGLPVGTPVLAAASGWAVATYGERLITHDDEPRLHKNKSIYFGSGLMVQIWHGQGRYTQYLHLDDISSVIPYHEPIKESEEKIVNNDVLRVPVSHYGKKVRAWWVEKGEVIGQVGTTGLGLAKSTYSQWRQNKTYESWDKPHLHFVVFGRRTSKKRNASQKWDPFGIYGYSNQYPKNVQEWSGLNNSLWLEL